LNYKKITDCPAQYSFYVLFQQSKMVLYEIEMSSRRKKCSSYIQHSLLSIISIFNQKGLETLKAFTFFRYIKVLSGQSNYVTHLMREAAQAYQDGKYDSAFLEYLVVAEAGVEMAQYNLGWLCQEFSDEVMKKRDLKFNFSPRIHHQH
jgi:hypothetical protein